MVSDSKVIYEDMIEVCSEIVWNEMSRYNSVIGLQLKGALKSIKITKLVNFNLSK